MDEPLKMTESCRSCLGIEEKMISIFKEDDKVMIYKVLMTCASVTILKDDGGPTKICITCLYKLQEVLNFRDMCEDADKRIQSYLSKSLHAVLSENISNLDVDGIKKEIMTVDDDIVHSETDAADCLLDNLKMELAPEKFNTSNHRLKECKTKNKEKPSRKNKKKRGKNVTNSEENKVYIKSECSENGEVVVRKRGRPRKGLESSRNKEIRCSVCNKVFNNVKSYEIHSQSHNETREHTCEQCGKQFKSQKHLRAHMVTHSDVRPYKCDTCGRGFVKKDNLGVHVRRHLKLAEWGCEVCGACHYTSHELRVHARVHTGERPYVCTQCGKRFTAKNNLYIHQRTHTGEKPHECEVCGKKFISKNILKIHTRTHTGERPYMCSICGKTFTANKLAAHMRTHSGERPHVCTLCGKQFSAPNVLMIHMRRHTGEKPYACRICSHTYRHSQSLNKHMRKQHKIVTNIQQLKMKKINEDHQFFMESHKQTINVENSSKDGEISPLQTHPFSGEKVFLQQDGAKISIDFQE